jgi:hypothetical protein
MALGHDDIDIANLIMSRNFTIQRDRFNETICMWKPFIGRVARNLPAFLGFLSSHPAHAVDLLPSYSDFQYLRDEGDLSFLNILAERGCDGLRVVPCLYDVDHFVNFFILKRFG